MKFAPDAMLAPAPRRGETAAADLGRRWGRVLTHTHTYSGRADHGGTVAPPESYRRLVEWAEANGIDAIGMGSPYTPATAATQVRYDGEERDAYYGGQLQPRRLRQTGDVEAMLAELRDSTDRCLFYLDNETPKGRYGHLWWIGYHPDLPPWHDYDQPFDRWMVEESIPGDDGDEPVAYERRPYSQIIAIQRAHGALGIWAHPTSWWRDDAGRFITNIASELPAHAVADGGVDGMVVMGYQPYRPTYQALWFALLDRGYRVPAAAEMDCGLSDPATWDSARLMLNHLDLGDEELTVESIGVAFRGGRLAVSSGPTVGLRVDGRTMGEAATTSRRQTHTVEIVAHPRTPGERLSRVELVGRGGRVLWRRDDFAGGALRVPMVGLDHCGYLVARAFGPATPGVTDHRRFDQFAMTNPVYLHPRGEGFAAPQATQASVAVAGSSPFHGGEVRFENAGGTVIERGALRGDGAAATLPANGRVTVVSPAGGTRTLYLINENPRVAALQRHLYRGRFLRDFPDRPAGDVPPEAWQLDEFPRAMAQLTLTV